MYNPEYLIILLPNYILEVAYLNKTDALIYMQLIKMYFGIFFPNVCKGKFYKVTKNCWDKNYLQPTDKQYMFSSHVLHSFYKLWVWLTNIFN